VVVGGGAGGVAEMIEDGVSGVLFQPGEAGACAAALARALAMPDNEARRMGTAAARRILGLCANVTVVAQRVEAFARSRGRGSGAPARRREVVVVNTRRATSGIIERLAAAVREGEGIDFAHGWTRMGERVRAFSTPALETLVWAHQPVGPVAISAQAAADPRIATLLKARGYDGALTCDVPWGLLAMLASAGYHGAVVPDAVMEELPHAAEQPDVAAARAEVDSLKRRCAQQTVAIVQLREELSRIKASRGWRVLQRVYDVLHLVRGRGVRRPRVYDRAEELGAERGARGRNQIA
jgi:hypothetical protein